MESLPSKGNSLIMEPKFTYKSLSQVNINEITKDESNSVLKIKINPNKLGEFLVVNSNFTMNYLFLNPDNASLTLQGCYKEHNHRIFDVTFFPSNQFPLNESFLSGDGDGNILLWDSRAKSPSKKISTHGRGGVASLDANSNYFAAGYGNEIAIWDIRTLKQIGKSSFAHSEPVTCVKFFENYLISGGEDNIINIFNISGEHGKNSNILDLNSVEASMNMGQSIQSVNTMKEGFISAITTVNTFIIINLNSCTQVYEFDAKNNISDYILDSYYDKKSDIIELMTGNNIGGFCCIDFTFNNPKPQVKSYVDTKNVQTFNSIERFPNNIFITGSDQGFIYIIQQIPGSPQIKLKETLDKEVIQDGNNDEDIEMKD